ncbi:MAG TPA: hypothetical protein VH230_03515 [Stellaceae bacterium]|jgi:hypothetical protein|nr:hypothetical protein [Stellaceae bacterium]
MRRQKINRVSAIAPFVMSLSAFILVLVAVATGWDKGLKDEGSAAHIFQLLIALQIPFILAFLVTADWKRFMRVAGIVSLQVAAVALAFGPVAVFKL